MLRIESNSNYQNPFTTYIPLTCTGVRADCSISPKQLDFGCVRIGSTPKPRPSP